MALRLKYVSPVQFRQALIAAKAAIPKHWRPNLHQYTLREYGEMRTFLSDAGWSGFAIKPDGDLVNLFNISPNKQGRTLVAEAVRLGATKLDCFDGPLVKLYESCGFAEYRREPFDPSMCPVEWLGLWYREYPDIVYMEYRECATITT